MYIIHRSSLSSLIITEEFLILHHCIPTVRAIGPQDRPKVGRIPSSSLFYVKSNNQWASETGESSIGELGSDAEEITVGKNHVLQCRHLFTRTGGGFYVDGHGVDF